VRLDAAASSALRSALARPARPANWLGVTPTAAYVRISSAPGVIALLAHDAVRLPCALLLPTTAAELPLTCLTEAGGDPVIGAGCLTWTGPAGHVDVRAVREWAPARVRPVPELCDWGSAVDRATAGPQPGCSVAAALNAARHDALPAPAALGIDGELLTLLTTEPATAVAGLLGNGPGLTPSGDDVLAGFLLGARAFGLDVASARAAVAAMAPTRTSALSAALLWHAARDECVDEVAAFVAHPSRPALSALLRVGHTSGAALGVGLATAALAALSTGTAGEAA